MSAQEEVFPCHTTKLCCTERRTTASQKCLLWAKRRQRWACRSSSATSSLQMDAGIDVAARQLQRPRGWAMARAHMLTRKLASLAPVFQLDCVESSREPLLGELGGCGMGSAGRAGLGAHVNGGGTQAAELPAGLAYPGTRQRGNLTDGVCEKRPPVYVCMGCIGIWTLTCMRTTALASPPIALPEACRIARSSAVLSQWAIRALANTAGPGRAMLQQSTHNSQCDHNGLCPTACTYATSYARRKKDL